MIQTKAIRYWVGAAVTLCLGCYMLATDLFDEDNIQPLDDGYYTASYDGGTALHWHKDSEGFGNQPLLDRVYSTQRNDSFLVVRAGTNFYFAFPVRIASRLEAQQKRLGPFSKGELNKKMTQLTGDSTLRQVGSI